MKGARRATCTKKEGWLQGKRPASLAKDSRGIPAEEPNTGGVYVLGAGRGIARINLVRSLHPSSNLMVFGQSLRLFVVEVYHFLRLC